MAEKTVRIAYDGDALQNGAMEISELAPALIAFGKFIQRANYVIGNDRPVKVMLKADDIRKGSFDISLQLVSDMLEQAKLFISGMEDTGLVALLQIIGYGAATGKGVFWLIKYLKGRKVTNAKKVSENNIELTVEGSITITITENLYNVFKDYEARQQIEKIIEPLNNAGINSFELRNPDDMSDKNPCVKIIKEETSYFKTPDIGDVEEQHTKNTLTVILKIVGIVFDENQKWRFTDGDTTFWAKINDEVFWQRVENRELAFAKGDQLKVVYTAEQKLNASGNLTVERTIDQVLEVIPKPTQIKLDFKEQVFA